MDNLPKWESVKYELGDEFNSNFENPNFAEITTAKSEVPSLEALTNVCRCCLQHNNLKLIYDSSENHLLEIVKNVAGIEISVNDGLPNQICTACEIKFENAFEIRQQTRKSDEILRNLVFKCNEYNAEPNVSNETRAENSADDDCHTIFLPEVAIDDMKIKNEPLDDEVVLSTPGPITTSDEIHDISEDIESDSKVIKDEQSVRRQTRNLKSKVKEKQSREDPVEDQEPTSSYAITETKEEINDDYDEDDNAEEDDDDEDASSDEDGMEKPKEVRSRRSTKKKEKVQSADTINRIMCEVSQSLVCHFCGKSTFTQPNRLKKHIYEYHSDTVFSCDICQKVFKSGNNLQRHKKLVHEKFRFKCDQCVCDFYTTSDLKRHKLDEHSDAEAKHQCDLCGKMFKHVILLETHRKWHVYHARKPNYNPENRDKFRDRRKDARPRCEACNIEKFTNKDDFKQHHQNHQGKYDCQICGKSFKTDNKLRLHKYINHSGKVYYCDKCEYKTTNPSNVQSHRRIHNENRHFECDICKKKTTTRLRMKIHRRIHTGEKPYCCAFCGKSFSDPSTFRKHKKRHEPAKDQSQKHASTSMVEQRPLIDSMESVHPEPQQHLQMSVSDRIPAMMPPLLPLTPLLQQAQPTEAMPYFT